MMSTFYKNNDDVHIKTSKVINCILMKSHDLTAFYKNNNDEYIKTSKIINCMLILQEQQ